MRAEERTSPTPCPVWGGSGVEKKESQPSPAPEAGKKKSSGWWKDTQAALGLSGQLK